MNPIATIETAPPTWTRCAQHQDGATSQAGAISARTEATAGSSASRSPWVSR